MEKSEDDIGLAFPCPTHKICLCPLLAEELEEISGYLLVQLSATAGPTGASHQGHS